VKKIVDVAEFVIRLKREYEDALEQLASDRLRAGEVAVGK
jgi:hypothetical protein